MIKATETKLKGCFVVEPQVFEDERGYFFESYNHKEFCKAIGQEVHFVQDNQSFSKKGVLRGLHYQKGKHAQAKLITVLSGRIQDVVVDLRRDSPTFAQHFSMELDSNYKKQLFIPKGFAHGFLVLSNTALVLYKCSNYYNPEAEGGIHCNSPEINIEWWVSPNDMLLSEKDKNLPKYLEG
jgi:dTDP-4-dehydrorhamnose 3,5-epimerase